MRCVYIFDADEAIAFLSDAGCPEEVLKPVREWAKGLNFATVGRDKLDAWVAAFTSPPRSLSDGQD